MTAKAEGTPVREGPFENNVHQGGRARAAWAPTANTVLYAPSARRRLALMIVGTYPSCARRGQSHHGSDDGGLPAAGCGGGLNYLLLRRLASSEAT
jgi:hypothetical protein